MQKIEQDLWFYDFEVTLHDWLCVLIKYTTKEKKIFHNDTDSLVSFINNTPMYMGGYNNKGYDQYILKSIVIGYEPEEVKQCNDWIIGGNEGWKWEGFEYNIVNLPPQMELIHDIVPRKSLKECEGNMCSDITESTVSFDVKHQWTKKELEEMIFYCTRDVTEAMKLYDQRKAYFQTKVDLLRSIGDNENFALCNTNANVVARYLGGKRYNFDETEVYQFPTNIDLSVIPEDIIHFYENMQSKYNRDGTINEDASSSYEVEICGVPSKLGFGGIHGALSNYQELVTEQRCILNADGFSFYPSIMLIYNHLSRGVTAKDRFQDAYNLRKDSKFNPNSKVPKYKIPGLKLILNTTFGTSGSKFNNLYDPLKLKSVCVHGQLFLIYLAQKLSVVKSVRQIQYNTDGIMFSVDKNDITTVENIIKAFEQETGFLMEIDHIKSVWQRDVNNYIVEMESGKIKSKGGVFSALNKAQFEANSLRIVSEAIIDYFTKNIPVEKTINECNDIFKFQMIVKTGSTYHNTVHYVNGCPQFVQKVNRIYATTDTKYGQVKKIKYAGTPYIVKKLKTKQKKLSEFLVGYDETDGKYIYQIEREKIGNHYIDRIDTVANCPEHAIIDNKNELSVDNIDKEWYIDYAKNEIQKFLGDDSMATAKDVIASAQDAMKVNITEEQLKEEATKVEDEIPDSIKGIAEKAKTKKEPKQSKKEPSCNCGNREISNPFVPMDIGFLNFMQQKEVSELEKEYRIAFYKKKAAMRDIIAKWQLPQDGYNNHQSYEYVKAFNYKTMLNEAARQVGMDVSVNINNVEQVDIKNDKMHMIRVTGAIALTDIETGYANNTFVFADGSDNLDKGIYKAYTMLIKAYVQLNFLRSDNENLDVEFDTKETTGNKPVTVEQRQEAKEAVAHKVATQKQLDDIVGYVLKIREHDSSFMANDPVLTEINNGTLDATTATKLLIELEEKMEEFQE